MSLGHVMPAWFQGQAGDCIQTALTGVECACRKYRYYCDELNALHVVDLYCSPVHDEDQRVMAVLCQIDLLMDAPGSQRPRSAATVQWDAGARLKQAS